MEVVIQFSLLTVSVCLGAAALVRRTAGLRSESSTRSRWIEVGAVSPTWLAEHRVRSRSE
jgi:hypothetical protein